MLKKILPPKDTVFVLLLREGLGASPEMFKYIFMEKKKKETQHFKMAESTSWINDNLSCKL